MLSCTVSKPEGNSSGGEDKILPRLPEFGSPGQLGTGLQLPFLSLFTHSSLSCVFCVCVSTCHRNQRTGLGVSLHSPPC